MNQELKLSVFSRRRGYPDDYFVCKTTEGWEIRYLGIGGICDKQGRPYLFENLNHDLINYPAQLDSIMENLWDFAENKNPSNEDLQKHLDKVSDWIILTEKNTPTFIN
jgi:hypothetical protein